MVKGLNLFRDAFRSYANKYILIGGAACDLALQKFGVAFRATRDLDIVLCVEVLDKDFVSAFWNFIRAGRYQIQQKATGKKQFYRFQKPTIPDYPLMLELFSRKPDVLSVAEHGHLTSIPVDEAVSSLSAILMDDEYYNFILSGRKETDGIPFVGLEHMIPLKARAWIDLVARKNNGENIDSTSIKKHKNDILRLYQLLDPDLRMDVPPTVKSDLLTFIEGIGKEGADLKSLGIAAKNLDAILDQLKFYYGLGRVTGG